MKEKKRVRFYAFPFITELGVRVTLSSDLTEKLSHLKCVRTQISLSISKPVCLIYCISIFPSIKKKI